MIIFKIFGFILLFVFMMGLLSGMGLFGASSLIKRRFEGMMRDFARPQNQDGGTSSERVETADVVMEECPKCGTFTEKNNYCESCGHSW